MSEPDHLVEDEELRLLKETMTADEVSEIVRWQMTGQLARKTPPLRGATAGQPRCPRCAGEWHGLKKEDCAGSFDTPLPDH